MLKLTINEIIEEFGYNCKEISNITGIGYNHVLGLKNFKHKYTKNDILKINQWLERRNNNIYYIDFKNLSKKETKIYKFEQKGIIDLNEFRKFKIKEQRRIDNENRQHERNEFLRQLFDK